MHGDPRIPLPRGWPQTVRSAIIHAISLAQFSLTHTRSWAANNWNARIRLKQENGRLRQEVALLMEEMRIKDARMLRIPAQRRPHYPPIERLAILELRAARAWSMSQTARDLLVTPATVASWMGRLDKVLSPTMGKVKLAQPLCRVGLHLAPTTFGRMARRNPPRKVRHRAFELLGRVVTAKRPNHVWLADLSAP